MIRGQLWAAALLALVLGATLSACNLFEQWSASERASIASLALDALSALAPDPSNAFGDNPQAAALGEKLFFDTRLSGNGFVSCSTCHLKTSQFQDDSPTARAIGQTTRRTMPIAGTAYSPWMFWDGRKDSQWSQALGPMESPVEHGGNRLAYAHLMTTAYKADYEALFGALPDFSALPASGAPAGADEAMAAWGGIAAADQDAVNRVFANIGKAIAAFERTIPPPRTQFDVYAAALAAGKPTEGIIPKAAEAGLKLFIGKGQCITCHNGPLLTDHHFHNTGVPEPEGAPRDLGRFAVLQETKDDPFNCIGPYSDAGPSDCAELKFMAGGKSMLRAYKTPSLRGVASRPPYMHAGQFETLTDVLAHYNRAPWAPYGVSELHRIALTQEELADLEAFLVALDPLPAAPIAASP